MTESPLWPDPVHLFEAAPISPLPQGVAWLKAQVRLILLPLRIATVCLNPGYDYYHYDEDYDYDVSLLLLSLCDCQLPSQLIPSLLLLLFFL